MGFGVLDVGIGLALLAAVLWGGYLFTIKRYFAMDTPVVVIVTLNICAAAIYVPVLWFHRPTGVPLFPSIPAREWVYVAAVLAVFSAAVMTLYHALARGDVSYVAPISKISPLFVLPIEMLVLGEFLTPLQVLGVGCATMGVYIANYTGGSLLAPVVHAATSGPARLALTHALLFGVYQVGVRYVLHDLALPTRVWVIIKLVGVAMILGPLAVRRWSNAVLAKWQLVAFAAVLIVAAEHVTALAFAATPASIASPIVNFQAIVAVLLGGIVLGESQLGLRIVAAAVAVVGVVLISVP